MEYMKRAQGLIEEMRRLAAMEGNCGRVIERFLGRTVADGEIEVRLEMPKEWRLLDVACFVAIVKQSIEARRTLERERPYPAPLVEGLTVFPWLSTHMVSFVIHVGTQWGSVSERKLLLKGAAQTLDLALDIQSGWMEAEATEGMRGWFLGEDHVVTEADLSLFDEVVRGVYTHVEKLPRRMAALANVINSQVQTAVGEAVDLRVSPACGAETEAA